MSDKAVRAAGKLQQRIEELEAEVLHENDLFLTQRNKTEELEAQLAELRRLSPYLFANDENYQIFRKALEKDDGS